MGAIYLVARNAGVATDTLRAIGAESAGIATLHESVHDHATNAASMRAVAAAEVPARGLLQLAPGGYHGMVAVQRALKRGDTVPLTLTFARAGTITVNAAVIAYADVDTATAPATTSR